MKQSICLIYLPRILRPSKYLFPLPPPPVPFPTLSLFASGHVSYSPVLPFERKKNE